MAFFGRISCGGYGLVILTMQDGSKKWIEFEGIESRLML